MTWQYPRWTMQEARALGFTTWDLYYTSWGVDLTGSDPLSFPSTGQPTVDSAYGVIVGPRSTVDRLFINATIPTPIVQGGVVPTWPPDGRRVVDVSAVDVRAPLVNPVSGPLSVNGWLFLFGPATPGPTQYYPVGGALTDIPLTDAGFEVPNLHLQFLLRAAPQILTRNFREPMLRSRTASAVGAGAEVFDRAYPVGGRRRATLQFRVPTGTVSFRVGLLSAGTGQNSPWIEVTGGTAAAVTGTASASIDLTLNHDYLFVYRTVGAGPADFQYDVAIID